jgi:hypothetical protein
MYEGELSQGIIRNNIECVRFSRKFAGHMKFVLLTTVM